jgi:hypothetical protein
VCKINNLPKKPVQQAYRSSFGTQAKNDEQDTGAIGGSGGRWNEVAIMGAYCHGRDAGKSLAEIAREHGISESTLRHWVSRLEASDGPAVWSRFFESPEGLQLLHMVVTAALFVITQICGGGVRAVCLFLQLSGLWRWVASGYGTQCSAIQKMEESIGQFGEVQRESLSPQVPPKPITLTEDETFHVGKPCLVASDPVSDFLFIEEYADDRRAETWNDKVARALHGYPVEVVQVTSDDAKALVNHAQKGLGVHHSPDLFHPLQDISRATSLSLGRKVTAAEGDLAKAEKTLAAVHQEAAAHHQTPYNPGRPPKVDQKIHQAEQQVADAQAAIVEAKQLQQDVRKEVRGISKCFHPFDLETGEARTSESVEQALNQHFDAIETTANEAGIRHSRCWELLDKARRLVPKMVATITFVHVMISETLSKLEDSESIKNALRDFLIPLLYLKEVARKATTADARDRVLQCCECLEHRSGEAIALLMGLDSDHRDRLIYIARLCAQYFQRSSSNVEGRNGFLGLRHHSIHLLCPRKLRALTVIHNYMIRRRSDGLTPAERLFEQPHDDLFQYLLMMMPPPKRPAARRPAPRKSSVLN